MATYMYMYSNSAHRHYTRSRKQPMQIAKVGKKDINPSIGDSIRRRRHIFRYFCDTVTMQSVVYLNSSLQYKATIVCNL